MLLCVEQATSNDIDSVSQLDLQVFGSSMRRDFLEKSVHDGRVWVVRNEALVMGFAVADQSFYGHTFIELLIVHPDFRRQGIGSLLVGKIETVSPTEKLFTSTNESNELMQCLCKSLGFTKSGYIENLDEGDPEIVYFKRVIRGE